MYDEYGLMINHFAVDVYGVWEKLTSMKQLIVGRRSIEIMRGGWGAGDGK